MFSLAFPLPMNNNCPHEKNPQLHMPVDSNELCKKFVTASCKNAN